MKSFMIFLISALSLANFPPAVQAQSTTPLTFTIDENNIPASAQTIINRLQLESLYTYTGFQSDFQNFLQDLINHTPACNLPVLTNCPPDPGVILNNYSGGIYFFELSGLNFFDDDNLHNLQSSYIRFNIPSQPGAPNFSILASNVNSNRFQLAHSFVSNTIILFSTIHPSGRSAIKAIIIADKYIL